VPSECNFIAPSVVRRGPLTIAISTGGTSPAMAKALRKELEALYGGLFSDYLGFVKKIRTRAIAEVGQKKKRESFLKGLASEKMLLLLRQEGLAAVEAEIGRRLEKITGKKQEGAAR
jgi:precorrin-2 dehydrogenase/sirohydrochlorin ferrochelatase